MTLPFLIDNEQHRMADVLNALLGRCTGGPLDIATAYFAISGFRLVKDALRGVGAFRLLLGSDPKTGQDLGLRLERKRECERLLRLDLDAEPFTEPTLRLVEELIAFLCDDKVQVRLYEHGFLHAKAYLFHRDRIGPHNQGDRMRPFAAIVGSSNFTGPGLASIVATIERLSLAPYQLESYRKESAIRDEQEYEWETGLEVALVGIFKTRFLKRPESSVFAFRESVRRALVFEETYKKRRSNWRLPRTRFRWS